MLGWYYLWPVTLPMVPTIGPPDQARQPWMFPPDYALGPGGPSTALNIITFGPRTVPHRGTHSLAWLPVSEENVSSRQMCPADTFSWEILSMGHIFLGNSVLPDRVYCPS